VPKRVTVVKSGLSELMKSYFLFYLQEKKA